MSLTVVITICYVASVLIICVTRNQNPDEKRTREGLINPTVVHTATHPELTTRLAKSRIREDRGRGFRPLGSGP